MAIVEPTPPGRRERNKQQKLQRIMAAADELFGRYGIDEVTTQQIADAADIGTGTLFLYARSKAELLLLVQNAHYVEAIDAGLAAAASASSAIDAVMALVEPVIECNRRQLENGRTYLRELVFGDSNEPHHRAGLEVIARAELAYVDILEGEPQFDRRQAELLARGISAIMFVTLASPAHHPSTNQSVAEEVREHLRVLLRS